MTKTEPAGLIDLPDVNVLVAIALPGHVHHDQAHAWLAATEGFLLTPTTESGFLRLVLNPAISGAEIDGRAALSTLADIAAHARAGFVPDDASFRSAAIDASGLTTRHRVTDLHLVDLAARHQARLVTFDRGIEAALVPQDRQHVHVLR